MSELLTLNSVYAGIAGVPERLVDRSSRDDLVKLVGDGMYFKLNHELDGRGSYQVGVVSIQVIDDNRFIANRYGLSINENMTSVNSLDSSFEWPDTYLAAFYGSLLSADPIHSQITYDQFQQSRQAITAASLYIYNAADVLSSAMLNQRAVEH